MTGQLMPIAQLQASPDNPRGVIDDASLGELVASIRTQGVLTPLLVRPLATWDSENLPDDRRPVTVCEVVAGHRRLRAAELAGLEAVPVTVRDLTDDEARELAIIENLQREDIRPLDEARSFQALLKADATPASIAARVGKPERYVWDRLRLLRLVPEAAMLLETDRITVQHAIVLSKLSDADQTRIINPERGRGGGLFEGEHGLWDEDDEGHEPGKWDGLKAVSVRELQRTIATYVRFDVQQAAAAAPLDFGPVAEQVAQAEAQPKRGRKVVHITRDSYVQPDAKGDGERIYSSRTWKRADSLEGSKVCDRAVLGLVVVGPGYGEAFQVCINKDCDVHWKAERQAVEKVATRTVKSEESYQDRFKREQAERLRDEKIWEAVRPDVVKALVAATAKIATTDKHLADVLPINHEDKGVVLATVGAITYKTFGRALVLGRALNRLYSGYDAAATLKSLGSSFDLKAAMKAAAATLDAPKKPVAKATTTPTKKAAKVRKTASTAKPGRAKKAAGPGKKGAKA